MYTFMYYIYFCQHSTLSVSYMWIQLLKILECLHGTYRTWWGLLTGLRTIVCSLMFCPLPLNVGTYLPEYNVWHPHKLDTTFTTMTATNLTHFEIYMKLPTQAKYEYFKSWQCPIYSNTTVQCPAGHLLHFYNKVTLQQLAIANSTSRIKTHLSGK